MGRVRKDKAEADRYIGKRSGVYQYLRRVPKAFLSIDPRGPLIRISLKTKDLSEARQKRDELERADDRYWLSLSGGTSLEVARAEYEQAKALAERMGFEYRSLSQLIENATDDALLARLAALVGGDGSSDQLDALLGTIGEPEIKISELLDIYVREIALDDIKDKSEAQMRTWRNVKALSITNFIEVIGDKAISQITRADAVEFHRFWLDRIAPAGRKPTHSASMGNRMVGNLRKMLGEYFDRYGSGDYQNPFRGLSFKENNDRSRPSFSVEWIEKHFLTAGPLKRLNREARAVFLLTIDSGLRPGEACNLLPEHIVLEHEVPHLMIAPVTARENYESRREIKTAHSKRIVPLVGVSLAVAKEHSSWFANYRDKSSTWSATVNKFLRYNHMMESDEHSAYCLRHSFEDRLKMAGVDEEVRKILMGHTIDRYVYGEGGALTWRRDQLAKIALPFDHSIV